MFPAKKFRNDHKMPSQLSSFSQFLKSPKESIRASVIERIFRRRSDATSAFDRTTVWVCAREYADSSAHIAHHYVWYN